MMRISKSSAFLLGAIAVLVGVAILWAFVPKAVPSASGEHASEDAVWTRISAAGTIRCGYITYQPYATKDPTTGTLSGIMVEAVETIGKKLGLKIAWVEETGYGTMFEGINAGRYDMLCSGLWQNSTRGKSAYFSNPLFFNAIRIWVRESDTHLNSLTDINSPDVRIAVQDQAIEDIIAQQDFPKAQRVSIPQLNPWSDNLLNIITRKADVTFAELGVIVPFLQKNPGTLRELKTPRPLRVFATSLPIRMGANKFKSVLDSSIMEILNDGSLEKLLAKYETARGELLRVAPAYEEPHG
jgi:polar amino acid transport system substrate-binding protein